MSDQDRDQFAAFAAARSGALFRTAYLMVGDHGLAQDLLQEALTKTYVAWPRIRDVGSAEPYCRRAIVTTAISWKRRRAWYGERPVERLPEPPPVRTDDVELRDLVWRALLSLPPRQRAALVLRFYEDLSESQIAEAMGCARGTVKSQISQGVATLRTRFGDRLGADLDLLTTGKVR